MERGGGRTGWVEGVDVDGEVDGVFGSDAVTDFLNDAGHADGVDFSCFYDFEAAIAVVVVVAQAAQGRADAGVDVGVVCQ